MSCLHQLFEGQADLRPHAPALISDGVELAYADVEQRANRMARHLREQGVRTGDLVGLLVERSPDAMLAILAILKAGAAYLPLDPSHPAERINHILEETSITLVITESPLSAKASASIAAGGRARLLAIDDPARPWEAHPATRLAPDAIGLTSSDLCYVLYTSGSTGRPKGVMTEHRHAVAFVAAFNQVVRLDASDRVFQGFSLGFDGSVEEMWMAFSNGGALVVPPRGAARFGDDLAHIIAREGATVFSTVPTSLAMISLPLSTVRLLIVSGERCPPDAVRRWATPGRRMLNVYGPTETTVNATAAECQPDRDVTIGRPLPGYGVHILDEARGPVAPGERGELYLTGATLARGYLGQPDLTRASFVDLPSGERAYRTGDSVSLDGGGDLLFHGRLDNQVKMRGYRIELSEIESVLGEHPAIRAAVVSLVDVAGAATLAAHVIARDPAAVVDRNDLLAHLGAHLPAYMVPAFLDVLDALPTLPSGKVDRHRLPPPVAALARTDRVLRAPGDALEAEILVTFTRLLRNDAISVDDDFFHALGGYSLLAAQVVSALRKEHGLEVAIRDIYAHPTIAQLATHLRGKSPRTPSAASSPSSSPPPSPSRPSRPSLLARLTRTACTASQAAGLYIVYAAMSLPYLGVFVPAVDWDEGKMSFATCFAIWMLIWLGTWPLFLLLSIAAKWLLIGRYRAGTYPLRGWYYLRFWLVRRFELLAGTSLLTGTPLYSLYLRAMGARVGRGCSINTPHLAIHDLTSIGDETSIGEETQLLGYRVEDGQLHVGSIAVGSRCFVGTHCALGVDVCMGNDARLDDQSLLPDGGWISAGESRRGSPAQPAQVDVPVPPASSTAAVSASAIGPRWRRALFALAHLVTLYTIFLLLIPAELPACAILWTARRAGHVVWLVAAVPVAATATVVAFCLWLVVLNHLFLPRVRPGVYRVSSLFYLRKWAADRLMQISRTLARPLYTTIYLPAWLRLLGATIGRRAEISTVAQISPKLTRIGEQSFFADGSIIGGNRIHRGTLELRESRIGRRSFVGNGAILPVGASLGDNCLLGCLSAPPAAHACTPDGTEWLGSPSFALPRRPRVGGFDASVTHEPTRKLIAQRLLIDGLRIILPATLVTAAFVTLCELVEFAHERLSTVAWLLDVPVIEIGVAAATLLCVVAIKKLLIGTFTPTVKPLWSMFVWLNEALNGVYETVAAPLLNLLLGSPFVLPWLRLMGCRIGRDAYIETTLFSEFDLVHVGAGAALNAGAVVQNHLFEDRIMKVSVVEIGDRCTVGNMAIVLYDTEMKTGSSIGPLSLLMKGETLAPGTRWIGIPTAQAAAAPALNPAAAAARAGAGALQPERALDDAVWEQSP